MPTLLLPPRHSPDTAAMASAAGALGWRVERLSSWRIPASLELEADTVLYGEPLFADAIADQIDLPLLAPRADWLATLPPELLLRRVTACRLAEASSHLRPTFIKPADHKYFPARVYGPDDPLPTPADVGADPVVIIAEPVAFELEFRCFVEDRRVLTSSVYLRHGELARASDGTWAASEAEAAAAVDFAAAALSRSDVPFPPALVLDVGLITGRGWAVIEANAAWGSGIYGCDPAAALRVVKRSCPSRLSLSACDESWLYRARD